MTKKIRVGIVFGGKSAEHEVSVRSARTIVLSIDKTKYEVVLIGIDKQGTWFLYNEEQFLLDSATVESCSIDSPKGNGVVLIPNSHGVFMGVTQPYDRICVDVVFPVLHGPYGEDGTVQGLLKLAGIPFVGAGVLGSAVGMDKDVMKRLLRDGGVPIGKFLSITKKEIPTYTVVVAQLGCPFFVKPANMGSSVGVSKVTTEKEYSIALQNAFVHDVKILCEENIVGREIECSVLGNSDLEVSVPGEVVVHQDFYSYDAKYIDDKGASFEIPAKISLEITEKIQTLALQTFNILCCEGMGRVDFFLKADGEILVNEINTIPGFTSISMYPKMWEASGISYAQLIDRLIGLAYDRYKSNS